MTIKKFLLTVSGVLLAIGGCFHLKYLKGIEFQKSHSPIEEFYIVDKNCSYSHRTSSLVKIRYNGEEYSISVSRRQCPDITNQYFKSKLYYMEDEDELFYEDAYFPFGVVLLAYIFALVIPLIGFVVYRKELGNHYSTMWQQYPRFVAVVTGILFKAYGRFERGLQRKTWRLTEKSFYKERNFTGTR